MPHVRRVLQFKFLDSRAKILLFELEMVRSTLTMTVNRAPSLGALFG